MKSVKCLVSMLYFYELKLKELKFKIESEKFQYQKEWKFDLKSFKKVN